MNEKLSLERKIISQGKGFDDKKLNKATNVYI